MKHGIKKRILSLVLCISVVLPMIAQPMPVHSVESEGSIAPLTNPFTPETIITLPDGTTTKSQSYRIPSMVTLADGTIVAAADIRWNTTYDGGCLDTLVARSTDGGATWTYKVANYLGDNGNVYNGSHSTAFLDPSLVVGADGKTVYMLVDLYPYGVALNGEGKENPSTDVGFDSEGNLLLKKDGDDGYNYYLKNGIIHTSNHEEVEGYTVDQYFNITGEDGTDSNLFFEKSPFKVVRTGYLYLTSSTDGGASWSAPTLLNNIKTNSEQACLVAPGSSITTSDGTMIFPVYSFHGDNEPDPSKGGNTQRLSFIYSKDGVNWSRTEELNHNWASEAAVVELQDGTLRFFIRNGSQRLQYVDYTMGSGWGTVVTMDNVKTNSNTQISAITYSRTVNGEQVILVSCPTGPDRNGSNESGAGKRLNGSIFVFTVNAANEMSLMDTLIVNDSNHQFMYSCLTERADGSIAILYEDQEHGWGVSGGNGESYTSNEVTTYYTMDIKVFDLEDELEDKNIAFDAADVTVSGAGIPVDSLFVAKDITDADELETVFKNIGKALYPDDPEEDQILDLNRPTRVLDLSFVNDGTKLQPTDEVTVSVGVASLGIKDGEKCIIYHLHDDGTLDMLDVVAQNCKVSFVVNSFSIVALASNEGDIYNVKTFYNVDSENISGNGQFYAAGVYFTDDGEAHVLIGGDFNTKQASKIEEVLLDGNTIITMDSKTYANYIDAKADIGQLTLYDGTDSTSAVVHNYNVSSTTDWLDINLGKEVTIGEYFQIGIKTSTGGGNEGVAFNLGIYVTALLDYDIVKTVHKVGDTVFDTKTATGSTGKEVIFKIEAQNQGDVDIADAIISESMPADIFDLSTIAYSSDLTKWTSVGSQTRFDISIGTLSAGTSQTYYVKATILTSNVADGTYTNSVELKSSNQDIAASDNASITMSSSYNIEKTVYSVNGNAPQAAGAAAANKSALTKAGDTIIYKVTVNNTGANALAGITITDMLPPRAYAGTVSCGADLNSLSGVTVSMNRFTIANSVSVPGNSSVTYYVKITLSNDILGGTYANTASMSITINNNTINLQDSANIVIPVILDQSITKDVYSVNGVIVNGSGVPNVYRGDTVIYKITVANNGNTVLNGTTIRDILPKDMYTETEVFYSADGMNNWTTISADDDTISFPVGILIEGVYCMEAGTSYTYYVKLTANSSTTAGGIYTNTAALHANTELCRDSANVNLIVTTSLTIRKEGYSEYESIDPKQTFLFQVTGENVNLIVTVHGDDFATINGLKVGGKYTVTELTDWSWRYAGTPDWIFITDSDTDNSGADTATATITLGATGNIITFTNTRDESKWLDGDTYEDNHFNQK